MGHELITEISKKIDTITSDISRLQDEKRNCDTKIEDAQNRLTIWRQALEAERKESGIQQPPLSSGKERLFRFTGMRLIDAIKIIREEQPDVTKQKTRDILEKDGYDFKGKRPGTAVHLAWVILDKRIRDNA